MSATITKLEKRWNSIDEQRKPAVQYALFAATLLVMIFVLYIRYFLGSRTLIFVESGADSWAQSVPFFLNAAERFGELDFSTWNFSQFLGTQTIQAVNPEYLVSVFGKDAVGPMMLVAQIIKIFLAGTFFYLFTGYWNVRYLTRFISGLGIAFCGRMTALAAWTGYTMEVTLAIALIWAFERFLANPRKFIALPISFALMVATLGVYGTVLYSFVMLVYVAFRIGYGNHRLRSGREIAIFLAKLAALYIVAILLIAVTLFPTIEGYLDSARVASNANSIQLPQTVTIDIYAAEALSLFTPSALGSMTNYSGPCNTLNNPYFYAGAIMLLGAPFAFKGKSRRQQIWLGVFAAIALAYVLSPSLRYILNGFGVGPYDFRMSSFWITIVLAVLGTLGIEALLKEAQPKPLACTVAALLALLGVACFILRDDVHFIWVALSAACLGLYAIVFVRGKKASTRAALLIAALCVCELLAQNYTLVNDVSVVTKDGYGNEYNNEFSTLIDEVDGDDNDLYRIDWKTPLLDRAMAYGYRGTQTYIGGTGISKAQTEFMANVAANDYIESLGYSRYAYGFYDNALNTLLGVRYLVYDQRGQDGETSYYAPYGYHRIEAGNGDFQIYKNDYALPFFVSYGYDETMTSNQLLALNRTDRSLALFERCVVPSTFMHNESAVETSFPNEKTTAIAASGETLSGDGALDSDISPTIDLEIPASAAPYLLLEMRLEGQATEGGVYAKLETTLANDETGESVTLPYLTAIGNEDIVIPVVNDGYTSARVRFTQDYDPDYQVTITNFTVKEAPESYFDAYKAACEDKLAENPVMTQATNDLIVGALDVADDGYIATSVPWSPSWRAYIDGVEVETFPVNYGFVGMETSAGHHSIERRYRDMPREIGGWLSAITLLCLVSARIAATRRRASTRQFPQR